MTCEALPVYTGWGYRIIALNSVALPDEQTKVPQWKSAGLLKKSFTLAGILVFLIITSFIFRKSVEYFSDLAFKWWDAI